METQLLEDFLQDEILQLERLEESFEDFNLFEVLGVVHRELQHSNVLGWLLDPNGSHGFGNYVLKGFIKLLSEISSEQRIALMLSDLEEVEVRREWKNIDVLILGESPDFLICIENKVWAKKSGKDQLQRYHRIIQENFDKGGNDFYVYLTPYPRMLNEEEMELGYQNVTYSDVLEIVELALLHYDPPLEARSFISSYVKNLKRHILMDSDSIRLAREIYGRHHKVIDFIVKHKPNIFSKDLTKLIKNWIESHDDLQLLAPSDNMFIRLLPKKLVRVFNQPFHAWEDKNIMFTLEIYLESERIWVKFCFGAVWRKGAEKLRLQKIKDDYYNTMTTFESLQGRLVASGPHYNYPAIARYDMLHIRDTNSVSPQEFFEDFKKAFVKFEDACLNQFTDECLAKLGNQ